MSCRSYSKTTTITNRIRNSHRPAKNLKKSRRRLLRQKWNRSRSVSVKRTIWTFSSVACAQLNAQITSIENRSIEIRIRNARRTGRSRSSMWNYRDHSGSKANYWIEISVKWMYFFFVSNCDFFTVKFAVTTRILLNKKYKSYRISTLSNMKSQRKKAISRV